MIREGRFLESFDISEIWAWIRLNEDLLWLLGAISVVSFITILIVVPILLVRLPVDYFMLQRRRQRDSLGLVGWLLRICKNVIGIILVGAGVVMLFLPGQGILTILVGLMITDFPGKHSLERWIIRRPNVGEAINWIRKNAGKPPLKLPCR